MQGLELAFDQNDIPTIVQLLKKGATDDKVWHHIKEVVEMNNLAVAKAIITPETAANYFISACNRNLNGIAKIALSRAVYKNTNYIETVCESGNLEIFNILVKKNFPISPFAYICAFENNHASILKKININIFPKSSRKSIKLYMAFSKKDTGEIHKLLDNGATECRHFSSMKIAVEMNDPAIMRKLAKVTRYVSYGMELALAQKKMGIYNLLKNL